MTVVCLCRTLLKYLNSKWAQYPLIRPDGRRGHPALSASTGAPTPVRPGAVNTFEFGHTKAATS